ncbi:MAG TPA: hypothetical protein VF184_02205 [Phycisphaeraceae bacterium]
MRPKRWACRALGAIAGVVLGWLAAGYAQEHSVAAERFRPAPASHDRLDHKQREQDADQSAEESRPAASRQPLQGDAVDADADADAPRSID